MASLLMLIILVLLNTVNSLYSGQYRDLDLVSLSARARNSESLFQSILCNFFTGDLAAVRIIGVSIIAGCPQGESWLWLLTVLYEIVPWDCYRFFHWLLPGRAGRWVKFRPQSDPQSKPIVQFITEPSLLCNRNFSFRAIFVWPWKIVSVSVGYLFYQPMDEKTKTWPLRFPAKENPNMKRALFDWPIVLQYDVKAKYRLISRKFLGHEA